MKSFRSSSPQSNRSTTSSAPSRLSWIASLFIISERAVDTLFAQKLIVTLYRLHPCRGKRFGAQHAHLKPTRFLPKKDWSFFYWFRHFLPRFPFKGKTFPLKKLSNDITSHRRFQVGIKTYSYPAVANSQAFAGDETPRYARGNQVRYSTLR